MSTSRLERVDGRDAVLDAALREFGRYGYADASLESILREGHMSEQLFRVHFEDKAGLAVAVIERERERHLGWVGHLRAATTKDQFWAAVRAKTVTELRPGETSSLDLARLSISAHRHHEVAVRLEPYTKRWHENLERILRRGQELHAVRTDLPMGVLVTMAHGLKHAAMSLHVPTGRTASDGEIVAFSRNYYCVLQHSLQARE